MKTRAHLWQYLAKFFVEWEMFQARFVKKTKAHIFPKIVPIMGRCGSYSRARQATGDKKIRRMRFACRVTKVTDTHWVYVILVAFPRQQWLRERSSVSYVHCLSCCNLSHTFKGPVRESGEPLMTSAQIRWSCWNRNWLVGFVCWVCKRQRTGCSRPGSVIQHLSFTPFCGERKKQRDDQHRNVISVRFISAGMTKITSIVILELVVCVIDSLKQ
jgi:hypothetical protein